MLPRREFIGALGGAMAALPFLPLPTHAASPFPVAWKEQPPWTALRQQVEPGHDAFAGERAAMGMLAALEHAMETGKSPLLPGCTGASPLAIRYEAVAPDVSRAIFGKETPASGWAAWRKQFTTARFFLLPDGIIRYEATAAHTHHVGQWRVRWSQEGFAHLQPLDEWRTSSPEPLFRDVTGALFAECDSFRDQLARGIPYWRARLDPASGIDLYGSNGISVADIDGDGQDEIYVAQPGGLPNRLYKMSRGGTLADISAASGLDLLDDTTSALFADWRNSGVQDAVVLRGNGPLLYLNDGKGRFTLQPAAFRFRTAPQGSFTGMAAADYDRDGSLDLYLCCYSFFQSEAQYRYPVPYHDARNGPPNFLFRNRLRDRYFEDVTAEAGLNENNDRFSFAPAWCDLEGTGWPSLYVANDFGQSNFYRNREGRFHDEAPQAGLLNRAPGMSAAWFDSNGSGHPDLYVSNMWSDAGQRVVREPTFQPAATPEVKQAYDSHTKGNSLYRNQGDGTFRDVAAPEGVTMGRWAWSSDGIDFDGDGIPEIFNTCGMLTNSSREDLMGFFWRQVVAQSPLTAAPASAYENGWNAINQFIREDYSWSGREPNVFYKRRGNRYYDFSGVSALNAAEDSRAFAAIDWDGDGCPDLVLKSRLAPQVRVFQNQSAGGLKWTVVHLRGTRSNRDAIGARVLVDGRLRTVQAGSGYLSQGTKAIHIGGDVGRLTVQWPSGLHQEFGPLAAGFRYTVTEGESAITRSPLASRADLAPRNLPALDNESRLHTTWFLEPIPLPEPVAGPKLLVIRESDLAPRPPEAAAWYALFRRYLFDYRTALELPLFLLVDSSSRAIKIYAAEPSPVEVQQDLATLSRTGLPPALPFAGTTITSSHRDLFKMAIAFYWAGYPAQALPYMEESLRRSPRNERLLLSLGKVELQLGKVREARIHLEKAREENANNPDTWNELGGLAFTAGQYGEAMACYQKALALDPQLPYALLNAAQTAARLRQNAEAESLFRRALKVNANSADAANGLGQLLGELGRYEEARQVLQDAIAVDRHNTAAINNLAVIYMKTGQMNDAIAALRFGIETSPANEMLYLNLGRLYAQSGRREQARETIRQLLEQVPDSKVGRHAWQELETQ